MGIPIPMLDLMFFLTENQDNPRHVGAVLIFQRRRRGGRVPPSGLAVRFSQRNLPGSSPTRERRGGSGDPENLRYQAPWNSGR
jgi:hypothetical protein